MRLLTLALKDIRILLRDRMGAFFIIGFPILMGLFFGLVMGGPRSGSGGKLKVALVNGDDSPVAAKFIDELRRNENLLLEDDDLDGARESVRLGQRTAMIVIPAGFGQSAGLLWETQPEIGVGVDPSRTAEAAMLEGFLMQASGAMIGERLRDPVQFLPAVQSARSRLTAENAANPVLRSLGESFFDSVEAMIRSADQLQRSDNGQADGETGGSPGIQFANIRRIDVTDRGEPGSIRSQMRLIRSRWDISFPQAMLWGVLSTVAGFAISLARERTQGTLVRLLASPLQRYEVVVGKALACFLTAMAVMASLAALGTFLGMRPESWSRLAVAATAVAFCFTGIMMAYSALGRTEQSVSGIGLAANMVMAMIGGAMIPVMFMPGFLQSLSVISPVRWSILAVEGAIWRGFSWMEMAGPLAVLVAVGSVGLAVGAAIQTLQRD